MTAPEMRRPELASDVLRLLETSGELDQWDIAVVQSERDDPNPVRVVFSLKGDDWRQAYVAHEFGRLIVTVNGWYHFDLDRLHEHVPPHTWVRQLEEKTWCTDEHLRLIERLYLLLPAPAHRPRRVRRAA